MTVETISVNTLAYDVDLCVGCGLCAIVCPHGVFAIVGKKAALVRHGDCIECGACQLNCPTGAITVDSGVGCAEAMIRAALFGGEPRCGCEDDACCGSSASCC